jgi:hypothetical protein
VNVRQAWLMLALALAGVACDQDHPCGGTGYGGPRELLRLKVEGSCVAAPVELELEANGCRLTGRKMGPAIGFPLHGAKDQAGHSIREGEWQLFGTACPIQGPCAMGQFRRCLARRVEWRIELDCFNDQGEPVCQAVLTE